MPPEMNGIELQVDNLVVCRQQKAILDRVSFRAHPGQLTAIIGPNGAGKTTLMRALSGERPDRGQVLINKQDLYADPEYWLRRIGYVPVDNILHVHLKLQDALMYIGRLRLANVTEADLSKRVDDLLTKFGFPSDDERRNKLIKVLSSGERKRANICSEILIDPPILLLDEPTSNLDPGAERTLMRLLAQYARNEKKTVLVITHTLNTIDLCDTVIFLANAQVIDQGKPSEVLDNLEQSLPTEANLASLSTPFLRWAKIFSQHATRTHHKDCTSTRQAPPQKRRIQYRKEAELAVPWQQQLRCLLRRYIDIRLHDRWNFIITLLAGFVGVLFFILPGSAFVKPFEAGELGVGLSQARQSVYLVALVVSLIGLITSYTDISKEYRIYQHERLKGLSPSAYLLSKWLWLTPLVGVLASVIILVFLVMIYQQPLPRFPELSIGETLTWQETMIQIQLVGLFRSGVSWLVLITLILSCTASMTVGLLLSALAGDSGKGHLLLMGAVVFIVLLSGLIRNPEWESVINLVSIASTGRWSYEGIASSIGFYCWTDSWRFDEFNSTGKLFSIWLSLICFIIVSMLLTVVCLRNRDPWYNSWANIRKLIMQDWAGIIVSLSIIVLLLSYIVFLREASYEYHALSYWSRQEYGGTSASVYANVNDAREPNMLQLWIGELSQARCEP